jgi:hypothetical protein
MNATMTQRARRDKPALVATLAPHPAPTYSPPSMARRRPAAAARRNDRHVSVFLDSVELARGCDGFLRGRPEPVLLFAAWSVGPASARLLGRAMRQLRVRSAFPCTSVPDEPWLLRVSSPASNHSVALLVLALERDAGTDVEWLYAALGDEDAVTVWTTEAPTPEPLSVAEAARGGIPGIADGRSVRLLRGRVDVEDECEKDDWVGAGLLVRPMGEGDYDGRLRFASRTGRNDWTARLRLRS